MEVQQGAAKVLAREPRFSLEEEARGGGGEGDKGMKDFLIILAYQIPASICALGVIKLAMEGKEGWGWLLVVALLLGSFNVKWKESKK